MLPALFSLGDAYFVLSGQQGDGTSFPQVKPHWVKRFILAGLQVNVYVVRRLFRYFGGFFFFRGDTLPQRIRCILIDFSDYAFDPSRRDKILLRLPIKRVY